MKTYMLRHTNSGEVKVMKEDIAKDFIYSPSWELIDEKGRVLPKPPKPRKINPVQAPPVFEKPKQSKSA